jgi:hypothetical protein
VAREMGNKMLWGCKLVGGMYDLGRGSCCVAEGKLRRGKGKQAMVRALRGLETLGVKNIFFENNGIAWP